MLFASGQSGVTISQLAEGLIVALAVAIVGAWVAYLLGKNGANEQAGQSRILASLSSLTEKSNDQAISMGQLTASLGPAVVELEALQVRVIELTTQVALLRDWRVEHERWSRESITRLDASMRAQRMTDGP